MNIRTALENDFEAIYNLVKTAFETAKVSDGTEQDFVLDLRSRSTYIPHLEFVAEEDGNLIGHILLTEAHINTNKNASFLLVAPLCVDIEHRNCGIGAALMEHALNKGKELGYDAALLVGDPAYYSRFGFAEIKSLGLTNDTGLPDMFVLGLKLTPSTFKDLSGSVSHLG